MGDLTRSVIAEICCANVPEDLDDWAWQAADLLAKAHNKSYHSGFPEIDRESVSPEDRDELRSALLVALDRNSDPKFVSAILFALGCGHDRSLRPLFVDYLTRYLARVKHSAGVVHATLIALDNIDEAVYETAPGGDSSHSIDEVDKNIRDATRYLERNKIIVTW